MLMCDPIKLGDGVLCGGCGLSFCCGGWVLWVCEGGLVVVV